MKRLILFLLMFPLISLAQDTGTIKIKKSKEKRTEGVASIAGIYYGKMQVDSFLLCEKIDITQDNGKLEIISFDVYHIESGVLYTYGSISAKIPEGAKAAVKRGGSHLTFENIRARYKNGDTVVLNPIILRIHDVSSNAKVAADQAKQSSQKVFATVAGVRWGKLPADSLLKHATVELTSIEKDWTVQSYQVTYFYKGTAFSLNNNGAKLSQEIKDLLKQSAAYTAYVYFENIKVKNKMNETMVLNPVIIRLK